MSDVVTNTCAWSFAAEYCKVFHAWWNSGPTDVIPIPLPAALEKVLFWYLTELGFSPETQHSVLVPKRICIAAIYLFIPTHCHHGEDSYMCLHWQLKWAPRYCLWYKNSLSAKNCTVASFLFWRWQEVFSQWAEIFEMIKKRGLRLSWFWLG